MIVGLDIDNVIADLDKTYLEWFLKEDKNKRNIGIINKNARHITDGMFDWSKEEVTEFLCNNMDEMGRNFNIISDTKYYINKLKEDGHKIYLLTHRKNIYWKDPKNITKEWLKKHEIHYDKLIFTKTTDKSEECIENKVDIMFDDVVSNCKSIVKAGTSCYLVKTRYNGQYDKGLLMVDGWKEIYETVDRKSHI